MDETDQDFLEGACLCGAVRFRIPRREHGVYQCHCSECRKITGSAANASCVVPEADFLWLAGEDNITAYRHSSGYTSHFCRTCGSATPNHMHGRPYFWIPAGALVATESLRLKAHLCVASKADWDQVADAGERNAEMPDFEALLRQVGVLP